ncbi:undecaprenyldiphospho-muramoylpentapeptide beta-N-acetylglucosaminyltransferase [Psychrobacter lutiphocae]|uniref:undecaprenyldiphospho-muramoylpentapeptide beta-N-acetylglucosaminyltransferase n=1 Tax=Psychrobacter lutiphocae TaxID=540500 RepID=UPI0003642012|nr:undecaprenyldiphospho-muramoylpentapeptide beta-N-acetylglucosaminyltransferase [Psychrobacter lutiphocae]
MSASSSNQQNVVIQENKQPNVLMMAAGTGGHVFPALAVAEELSKRGANIHWLGTPKGMENDLVRPVGYTFHTIDMQGLRGKGIGRMLKMPFTLTQAVLASIRIIKSNNIDVVVGFGGYVSAPGGLAAKATGTPLIIHEQNAIAGMSNRYLAKIAAKVLQAFPKTFGDSDSPDNPKLETVGNPVRQAICDIAPPEERYDIDDDSPLRLLIVGGSLGAEALNKTVPAALAQIDKPFAVYHQCGRNNLEDTKRYYQAVTNLGHQVTVMPFIDDMAAAYTWADVIVCRAGALTVTEIQNVGLAAIFVPLPHAVDDHQTANARSLAVEGAAYLVAQSKLSAEYLAEILLDLDRSKCQAMAQKGRALANPKATVVTADLIWSQLPPHYHC